MNLREAAGFVLIRRTSTGLISYLLLYSERHHQWGLPKGHRDDDDDDLLATSQRELKEETGISNISIIQNFECILRYRIQKPVSRHGSEPYDKRVVYFLAECPKDTEVCLSDEHTEYRWADVSEALELLPYDDLRGCIEKAQRELEQA